MAEQKKGIYIQWSGEQIYLNYAWCLPDGTTREQSWIVGDPALCGAVDAQNPGQSGTSSWYRLRFEADTCFSVWVEKQSAVPPCRYALYVTADHKGGGPEFLQVRFQPDGKRDITMGYGQENGQPNRIVPIRQSYLIDHRWRLDLVHDDREEQPVKLVPTMKYNRPEPVSNPVGGTTEPGKKQNRPGQEASVCRMEIPMEQSYEILYDKTAADGTKQTVCVFRNYETGGTLSGVIREGEQDAYTYMVSMAEAIPGYELEIRNQPSWEGSMPVWVHFYQALAKPLEGTSSGKNGKKIRFSVQAGACYVEIRNRQGMTEAHGLTQTEWRYRQQTGGPAEFQEERRKALQELEERKRRETEEWERRAAEEKARREAAEKARRAAEEKARREAAEKARREAAEKARREAEEKARREAEEKARREAAEKARREAAEKVRRAAEEKARREALARRWAEGQARLRKLQAQQVQLSKLQEDCRAREKTLAQKEQVYREKARKIADQKEKLQACQDQLRQKQQLRQGTEAQREKQEQNWQQAHKKLEELQRLTGETSARLADLRRKKADLQQQAEATARNMAGLHTALVDRKILTEEDLTWLLETPYRQEEPCQAMECRLRALTDRQMAWEDRLTELQQRVAGAVDSRTNELNRKNS